MVPAVPRCASPIRRSASWLRPEDIGARLRPDFETYAAVIRAANLRAD
jgi:hypothetical protein